MMETTVANVRGSTLVTPKGVAVDVQRYGVVLRGLAGADVTGTGELHPRAGRRLDQRTATSATWGSTFVYVRSDGSTSLDVRAPIRRRARCCRTGRCRRPLRRTSRPPAAADLADQRPLRINVHW
jgi:hypothetical protein